MSGVSVIVEWETALDANESRGVRCLEALHRELRDAAAAELIICFDARQATRDSVLDALREAGGEWPCRVEVVQVADGLDYYGKKNHGFSVSTGDIVVFLDSDIIPEPGCLANLVAPFSDFRKSVVVGRTHLDTASVWQRAVALFWIFETRAAAELRPTRRLLSNSVAFRRAVFRQFPFRQRPTFRGPCSELAATLIAHGIVLWEQTAARASHPAPKNPAEFLKRAFYAGTDQWFYDDVDGDATLAHCAANWREDMRHVAERIERRRHVIGAGIASILLAWMCGFAYYATKAAGYCARLIGASVRESVPRAELDRTAPRP